MWTNVIMRNRNSYFFQQYREIQIGIIQYFYKAESLSLILILMTSLLTRSSYGIPVKVNTAVFVHTQCASHSNLLSNTVDFAITTSESNLNISKYVDVTPFIYSSCVTSPESLVRVVSIFVNDTHPISAIVGPADRFLCDVLGQLAGLSNIPLISYNCIDTVYSNKRTYSTMSTVVPSNSVTSTAVAAFMRYFQWRSMAIVYADSLEYFELQETVDAVFSMHDEFNVPGHFRVDSGIDTARAVDILKNISTDVRGLNIGNFYSITSESSNIDLKEL